MLKADDNMSLQGLFGNCYPGPIASNIKRPAFNATEPGVTGCLQEQDFCPEGHAGPNYKLAISNVPRGVQAHSGTALLLLCACQGAHLQTE